ncbi:MAG: hypothetical protein L3J16_04850, partial [Anaerolineales bacterium]|nr:hypothetical protein [Anaerolineales bacterium]
RWYVTAQQLAEEMLGKFSDPAGGFFDTTQEAAAATALPVRPKELQDNAIPSGNALATEALLRLAAFSENGDYRQRAEAALGLVGEFVTMYPTAFGQWLSTADFAVHSGQQVAVTGDPQAETTQALLAEIRSKYRPNLIVAQSAWPPPDDAPSLLHNRPLLNEKPTAYVCEGFTCQLPVTTSQALRKQLD